MVVVVVVEVVLSSSGAGVETGMERTVVMQERRIERRRMGLEMDEMERSIVAGSQCCGSGSRC